MFCFQCGRLEGEVVDQEKAEADAKVGMVISRYLH